MTAAKKPGRGRNLAGLARPADHGHLAPRGDAGKALADAQRAIADAIEALPSSSPSVASDGERYYTRSTSPIESRAWDRAVRELAREGRVFRPGRETLIRRDHLHEWIESHAVNRPHTELVSANDDGPLPYELFSRARRTGVAT